MVSLASVWGQLFGVCWWSIGSQWGIRWGQFGVYWWSVGGLLRVHLGVHWGLLVVRWRSFRVPLGTFYEVFLGSIGGPLRVLEVRWGSSAVLV